MMSTHIHSVLCELQPSADATVPLTMGQQVHGLFLSWIRQLHPTLNAQLHHGPLPRPYTLSSLLGCKRHVNSLILRRDVPCYLRLTLLDGGDIWKCLNASFAELQPLVGYLGSAEVRLAHIDETLSPQSFNWVGSTDWQTLTTTPSQHFVTFCFVSPTAFSLGQRHFELFPYSYHVWTSVLRAWNAYAPERFHMDERRVRQACADHTIGVAQCDIQTHMLHFPNFVQKGFIGTCTYFLRDESVSEFAALAAFAQYAGVGYKTTMGMGQVRTQLSEHIP